MIEHGEQILDVLGSEIDKIKNKLRYKLLLIVSE